MSASWVDVGDSCVGVDKGGGAVVGGGGGVSSSFPGTVDGGLSCVGADVVTTCNLFYFILDFFLYNR